MKIDKSLIDDGRALLNHRPYLQEQVKKISFCDCSAHWCDHDLALLAVLDLVDRNAEIRGYREAMGLNWK